MTIVSDIYLTELFLVLSDATRLKLVRLMAAGEVSVGSLAASLDESQPKVSRHLAFMRDHGVVSTRRAGKNIFYALNREDAKYNAILIALLGETAAVPSTRAIQSEAVEQSYAPRQQETLGDELPIYLL